MCGGRRVRGSRATESSTGIPKRYGKHAEVDGKKERLSGGLFLSLFPSDWPQFLVAQRGLCRGYRPKMKVSLLQRACARYLSQESRFTNYPLWRPFFWRCVFEFMRGKCAQGLGERLFARRGKPSYCCFFLKFLRLEQFH